MNESGVFENSKLQHTKSWHTVKLMREHKVIFKYFLTKVNIMHATFHIYVYIKHTHTQFELIRFKTKQSNVNALEETQEFLDTKWQQVL